MSSSYDELVARLGEILNVERAMAVLDWDQQVNMPPAGTEARAAQMATLTRIHHEMLTAEETAELLESAEGALNGAAYDTDEAAMLRVVRRDYEQATKLPGDFVAEQARVFALAHDVWAKARQEKDYAAFRPTLEKILDIMRQEAEYLGYGSNPYDALLDKYEQGITAARVKEIFDGHKDQLVELIAAISEHADRVDDSPLHQNFDIDAQRAFGLWVVKHFGFDFERGRQDIAVHPFATSFSVNDVRITTRFNNDFLNPALFGLMHESGHGMYELGVDQSLEGTALAGGTSLAVHELQSRLWENVVGRSRGFWQWALPELKKHLPQLGGVSLDDFYRAVNRVHPSYIRVEADEATYNLHIMLRFELENDMVNGKVDMARLPQEWNERFEAYLGIVPPDDALGVLQDVHWSAGLMGYFPTYALGNLLSAQYYAKALGDHPDLPDQIASGKFDTLHNWMREHIYRHGRKFTSEELTQRVTGEGIQSRDYIAYLKNKYSEIYGL